MMPSDTTRKNHLFHIPHLVVDRHSIPAILSSSSCPLEYRLVFPLFHYLCLSSDLYTWNQSLQWTVIFSTGTHRQAWGTLDKIIIEGPNGRMIRVTDCDILRFASPYAAQYAYFVYTGSHVSKSWGSTNKRIGHDSLLLAKTHSQTLNSLWLKRHFIWLINFPLGPSIIFYV